MYGRNILLQMAKMSPNPTTGHFLVVTNPASFQYIKLTVFFKFADFLFYHFLRERGHRFHFIARKVLVGDKTIGILALVSGARAFSFDYCGAN